MERFSESRQIAVEAMSGDSKQNAAAADPDWSLSRRQEDIIQALGKLGAVSFSTRKPVRVIALKAAGFYANRTGFKKPIAALVKMGLIATRGGRTGGCWLMPAGIALYDSLCQRNYTIRTPNR